MPSTERNGRTVGEAVDAARVSAVVAGNMAAEALGKLDVLAAAAVERLGAPCPELLSPPPPPEPLLVEDATAHDALSFTETPPRTPDAMELLPVGDVPEYWPTYDATHFTETPPLTPEAGPWGLAREFPVHDPLFHVMTPPLSPPTIMGAEEAVDVFTLSMNAGHADFLLETGDDGGTDPLSPLTMASAAGVGAIYDSSMADFVVDNRAADIFGLTETGDAGLMETGDATGDGLFVVDNRVPDLFELMDTGDMEGDGDALPRLPGNVPQVVDVPQAAAAGGDLLVAQQSRNPRQKRVPTCVDNGKRRAAERRLRRANAGNMGNNAIETPFNASLAKNRAKLASRRADRGIAKAERPTTREEKLGQRFGAMMGEYVALAEDRGVGDGVGFSFVATLADGRTHEFAYGWGVGVFDVTLAGVAGMFNADPSITSAPLTDGSTLRSIATCMEPMFRGDGGWLRPANLENAGNYVIADAFWTSLEACRDAPAPEQTLRQSTREASLKQRFGKMMGEYVALSKERGVSEDDIGFSLMVTPGGSPTRYGPMSEFSYGWTKQALDVTLASVKGMSPQTDGATLRSTITNMAVLFRGNSV